MPTPTHVSLFTVPYLSSLWSPDFRRYLAEEDAAVREALVNWSQRISGKETTDELAFTQAFFQTLWNYEQKGRAGAYSLYPKYPIAGAGEKGGTGQADLALGWFGGDGGNIPQALCEFKDHRSALDAPQRRKGNNCSPVKQCFDYLREAANALYGHEPVKPTWRIVTDMNEFRLYHRMRAR